MQELDTPQNNFNSLLNPISVLTLTLAAVWVRSQLSAGSHKKTELITFLLINLASFLSLLGQESKEYHPVQQDCRGRGQASVPSMSM